ncbi:TetR/AcrR family transcriptional regulator [Mesorhizobium sp. dw_380]|uniref:TetR/AcrR family transcriptional regulator n=1 Tax=Mesorhizobium sp. dw_380 TaxID=2812001 RepID=UPI001BDF0027|nr:TetR/AcrR family transcriptional regulator [Mesorhizobium sp. dw_380]
MGRHKEFDPQDAVASASLLFWRKGYRATTPNELVAELGVGKGSLYNVFSSKHALFEQSLRHYGDARIVGLKSVLAGPGPVKVRLQAALERIASIDDAEKRRRGCMAVNTATELGAEDDPAAAIARSVFERMEHALLVVVEEGQQSGELSKNLDAGEIASLLLISIMGMSVSARAADDAARIQKAIRALLLLI